MLWIIIVGLLYTLTENEEFLDDVNDHQAVLQAFTYKMQFSNNNFCKNIEIEIYDNRNQL